jgi:hypothetical protein
MKALGRSFCLSALLCYAAFGQLSSVKTVFIIVMENKDYSSIVGNSGSAPYINGLIAQGASAANYNSPSINTFGHAGLPYYLWLEAGTNFGITLDADPFAASCGTGVPQVACLQATTLHLVTQLTTAGVTWKSYQEDMTQPCQLTAQGQYMPEHNPFLYFSDVANSTTCTANVRPYSELATDFANNTVPQYVFITPNLCHDMHYPSPNGCTTSDPILEGDNWLSTEVPKILASVAYQNGGALFITWDQSEQVGLLPGGGHVPMIVMSPAARGGGYQSTISYTPGSTLRTFEEIFGVPLIGDALNQNDLSDLFNPGTLSPCAPGTYSQTGNQPCTPAPAGSYDSGTGNTSSMLCPVGTFSSTAGATACTPAPAGSYDTGTGNTSSLLCPAGTFSSTTGASACTPAPAGSFVDTAGSISATLCAAGTFSSTTGAVACTQAAPGSYDSGTGNTSATPCPAGTFGSTFGAIACTPAPAGSYDSDTGNTSSTLCAAGTYSSTTGASSCTPAQSASAVASAGRTGAKP